MHARVSRIAGSSADIEAAIADFRARVVPFSRDHGRGAILLVDRASGEALAITLWEDEAALHASEEQAAALRQDAADQMSAAGQPKVACYEVAVFEP